MMLSPRTNAYAIRPRGITRKRSYTSNFTIMNFSSRIYTLLLLVFVAACGSDDKDEPSVEEQQLTLLSKTWVIKSAVQNVDRTTEFKSPDLTLTLSGAFDGKTPKGPYSYSITGKLPSP